MISKPNFGGTEVALLCNPDISDEAIKEIYDTLSPTAVDNSGVYSQFSTLVIVNKIKDKQIALPDEDEDTLLEIYDYYDYIEI